MFGHKDTKPLRKSNGAPLFLLPVGDYCNDIDKDRKDRQHYIVECKVLELASFQAYGPEDVDKIGRGEEIGKILCPGLHRTDRSEYSAHEHENQNEEQHQENGLQEGIRIVGYKQTESGHEYQEKEARREGRGRKRNVR